MLRMQFDEIQMTLGLNLIPKTSQHYENDF